MSLWWDPYEGLWNARLLARLAGRLPRRLYRAALVLVVGLDTLALWVRALGRRARRVGVGSLLAHRAAPADRPVVYLDLGTHAEARELALMADRVLPRLAARARCVGFEAAASSFRAAAARFAGRADVAMVHAAVCGDTGTARLYRDGVGGLGDSLYREAGAVEEVPAIRLSEWLQAEVPEPAAAILLLRMNIEGAELDVVADLAGAGLLDAIDGHYGMWNDVAKLDPGRGEAFRALLAAHGIAPFTFNGRDLAVPLRRQAIAYDVATSVLAASAAPRR